MPEWDFSDGINDSDHRQKADKTTLSDSHTLRELYEEGRRILRAAGIADADPDARILLEEGCGITLQTILMYPGKIIPDGQAERYRGYIARRAAHEPTAMILGKWDFCGLTFKVTKDTLIPEQDTECLVETVLKLFAERTILSGSGPAVSNCGTACKGAAKLSSDHDTAGTGTDSAGTEGGTAAAAIRGAEGAGVAGTSGFRAPFRILDLCTGSGCILLSLLHFLPEAEGVGTDLSSAALAVALENAEALGLSGRSLFLQGDLWEALSESGTGHGLSREITPESGTEPGSSHGISRKVQSQGQNRSSARFDLIVSNPPYIPTEVIPTLQPEVREGEPRMALDGGPDGLVFYRRIFAGAGRFLKPGGTIIVESGFDEAAQIQELMQAEGFTDLSVVQDYGGKDRVVTGRFAG